MAELKTKRLSTAEIIEEPGENTYILLEEDGAVKRIAGENLKTAGGNSLIYPLYVDIIYDENDNPTLGQIQNMPTSEELAELIHNGCCFALQVRNQLTNNPIEGGNA